MEMRVYRIRDELELMHSVKPDDPQNVVYRSLNQTSAGPALVYLRGCASRDFITCICPIDRLHNHADNTLSLRLRGWILVSIPSTLLQHCL